MNQPDPLLDGRTSSSPAWTRTTRVETGLSQMRPGLKFGVAGDHELSSDEAKEYGGEGESPSPLAYFGLAAGWCVLSQLMRYARARRIEILDATCDVELDWELSGSVIRGDVQARCLSVRYSMYVESPDDDEAVRAVVQLARQGCFVEQALRNPVDTDLVLRIGPGETAA